METKITLKTSLQYLKGVGPERSRILSRLGLESIGDLLCLYPRRYEHRLPIKRIAELGLVDKECVSGVVTARALMRLRTGQTIFRAVLSDDKHSLVGIWFNQPYLHKVFIPKSRAVFYGKAERSGSRLQMTHPEYELFQAEDPAPSIHTGRIVPIYPLTEEITQKGIRQLIYRALEIFGQQVRDPLPLRVRDELELQDRARAVFEIHFPSSAQSAAEAYRRLVFDEFFMMQIFLEIKKARLQKERGPVIDADKKSEVRRFIGSLEFQLTKGQEKAVWEIIDDMSSGSPMNRLVQGDVGSGKTVVAAAALVFTAVNGLQGAMMAPTEVLAQQIYVRISQLAEPMGINCAYLAQNLPTAEKEEVMSRIQDGRAQIVIGTHALIQEAVSFKNLGLAVIDEQHKFGVFQRVALKKKSAGAPAHFLVMTATPIPRTLALTLYGDLDVSVIAERPSGRQSVKTFWVDNEKRADIYVLLDALVKNGGQGYVLCPAIQIRPGVDAKTVFAAHQELSSVLSHRRFGILHGKMKSDEKKRIMKEFHERKIDVLISTVVIEVGVDVPNANIMIIENAEKFGLAQLHQLRGRVGRGAEESFCVLFSESTDEETIERLRIFTQTESGFEIAQKDLDLRGGGDIIGHKQHGLPELKIGDITKDIHLMELAKKEAVKMIAQDPDLLLPAHSLLRRSLQERFRWRAQRSAVSA